MSMFVPGFWEEFDFVPVQEPDDTDPEELAMMEEAYGGERYRATCSCGADLEDAPLPGCEAPFVHGDDVYK